MDFTHASSPDVFRDTLDGSRDRWEGKIEEVVLTKPTGCKYESAA